MCPPLGYTYQENKLFSLCKALCGLNKAPKSWFSKFNKTITKLNFSLNAQNYSFFTFKIYNYIVVLLLYVNDMTLT